MGMVQCSRCGRLEDEASASIGETGLVCASCHAGAVAGDRAQMYAGLANTAATLGAARGSDGYHAAANAQSTVAAELLGMNLPPGAISQFPSRLHEALAVRGLVPTRKTLRHSIEVADIQVRAKSGYAETWVLPSKSAMQCSFSKEGLTARFVKLFRSELQTGDAEFDKAVYIRTDTPEATAEFLKQDDVRAALVALVEDGGELEIRENRVEGEALWSDKSFSPREPDLIARVVRALVGG